MDLQEKKAVIDLGVDLALNKMTKYSVDEANEKLRKIMLEIGGCEDGKYDWRQFRKRKLEVFEIIEEVLNVRLEQGIKNQFDPYVDYRSVDFGEQVRFYVPNMDLFEVSSIAGGTNNLRRQRISGSYFTVETNWDGVKFYEELELFLTGKVDWQELINRVERSFVNRITTKVYDTLKAAYNGLTAPYKVTGSWDGDKFIELVEHIRAATGMEPLVVGTLLAVRKAVPQHVSDNMRDQRNQAGFFRTVDGINFGVIPQVHKPGTDEFAIDNNFLLVLPNGDEKILKVVNEGSALIKEVNDQNNADDSQEYSVRKKYGVAAVSASKYGVYILS